MSYARFGSGGSDVYVFEHAGGYLTCCACRLNGEVELDDDSMLGFSFPPSWDTPTTGPGYSRGEPDRRLPSMAYGEMIAHLSEHVDAGHHVPPGVFTRLHREQYEAISYEGSQ